MEVGERSFQFLYDDEKNAYLCEENSLDEIFIPKTLFHQRYFETAESGQSIKVKMLLNDNSNTNNLESSQDTPIYVDLPRTVNCTVADMAPVIGSDENSSM